MSLVTVLIAILIVGLILYAINYIPLPPPFRTIAYVVVIIALIIWLARAAGFMNTTF